MLNKQIETERILAIGYGEKNIRNRCVEGVLCSEEEHQMNRRTEVVIRKIDTEAKTALSKRELSPQPQPQPVEVSNVESQLMYYVIAGTFRNPTYAATQAQLLISLGYNTEVLYFDPNLRAMCVGVFNNEAEASRLASEISSGHNIETYVKEVVILKEDELK